MKHHTISQNGQMAISTNLQFQQNPIGYNETKGVYFVVYTPIALDFFTGMRR
jgi:hypothetical protein